MRVDGSKVSNKTFNLILIYTIFNLAKKGAGLRRDLWETEDEVLQGLSYYQRYVCCKSDPLNKAKGARVR